MGMFDTVWINEEEGIQFKSGECIVSYYDVGDKIEDLWDGIHFGFEGSFVVYNGIIVAVFSEEKQHLFSKWGGSIPYPELNR